MYYSWERNRTYENLTVSKMVNAISNESLYLTLYQANRYLYMCIYREGNPPSLSHYNEILLTDICNLFRNSSAKNQFLQGRFSESYLNFLYTHKHFSY